MQERSSKKARMVKLDTPNVHFCKPVKQDCNGILKVWPIWDPVMKLCNEGMRNGVVKVLFQVPQLRSLLWSKKIADLDLGTTPSRNEELGTTKDPLSRSFDDYKGVFDLEIDQLADEYELGIGKKGHMLDDIWEYCKCRTPSISGPVWGCDRLVSRAMVIENQVMAALVISISSDLSDESVGSSILQVILIGSIFVE
ncbi:hypothetical protein Tco_0790995, partial [Tanacetum coccineum]